MAYDKQVLDHKLSVLLASHTTKGGGNSPSPFDMTQAVRLNRDASLSHFHCKNIHSISPRFPELMRPPLMLLKIQSSTINLTA